MTDEWQPRTEELPATPTTVVRLLLKLLNAVMEKRVVPSRFTRKVEVRQEGGNVVETSTFCVSVEATLKEKEK